MTIMMKGYLLCVALTSLGLYIFLRGFLYIKPMDQSLGFSTSIPPEPDDAEQAHRTKPLPGPAFSRMVFILIDALRLDFIPSVHPLAQGIFANQTTMPFVEGLLSQRRGKAYINVVHSPTVTMPRIKSITSGSIPGFVDVILNPTNTKEFHDDNIISQAKRHGLNMVFYGDDTWLKLFPNHFLRSEGTTSFFVPDFDEVDHNVTRHLPRELEHQDWKIMILHYLGLDHIGHSLGVSLPHLKKKLREMDQVIERIYRALEQDTLLNGVQNIIVLCGDHGMSASGSHGGVSNAEILTPFIVLSTKERENMMKHIENPAKISQIDIAPTLAMILGIPIPQNSIGLVVTSALELVGFSVRQVLHALYCNAVQIMIISKSSGLLDKAIKMHSSWLKVNKYEPHNNISLNHALEIESLYKEGITEISESLIGASASFDMHALVLGVVVCLQAATAAGLRLIQIKRNHFKPVTTAFQLLLYNFIVICVYCFIFPENGYVNSFLIIIIHCGTVLSAGYSLWILIVYSVCPCISSLASSSINSVLVIFIMLHILSYTSSSYIEEEHQTWYFLCTTLLLFLFVEQLKLVINISRSSKSRKLSNPYLQIYESMSPHTSASETLSQQIAWHFLHPSWLERTILKLKAISRIVALAILFRISRSWNQTGDKWAHLPDIGDWMDQSCDERLFASIVVAFAVILMITILSSASKQRLYQSCLLVSAITLTGIYKSGIFKANFLTALTYLHLLLLPCEKVILMFKNYLTSTSRTNITSTNPMQIAVNMWIILSLLLQRPHNFPLMVLMVIEESLLAPLLHSFDDATCFVIYYAFGSASFFQQGNSNSLSTIDVAAGYTGLENYNQIVIGLLILCNTFSGPVFWMLKSVYWHMARHRQSSTNLYYCLMMLTAIYSLRLCCYIVLVIIQRYHIFIWTVFSPKLLYEIVHMYIHAVFALVMILVLHFARKTEPHKLI